MKDNTVNADGIEVYTHKIFILCDEYINSLSDDREEAEQKMEKRQVFKGMLKYIYINLFKPKKGENLYNNSIKRNSNLNYDDIDLLNDIWDIYTELCYKYGHDPALLNFSVLTGISMDWMNDIKNEKIRVGSDGASSEHCQSVKKWLTECEAGLHDGAASGNPGSMFLLKANYGYSEQPQQIQIIGQDIPQQTPAQIAERYAQIAAEEPKMPEL